MIPPHPWGLFFQSAIIYWIASLRDKFYYLGPVVKPRDDKFLSFLFCSLFKKKERCVILGLDPRIQVNKVARMRACIIFKVQSANVVSRCDSINYLGPVVKPRDDKKGTQGPGRGMTSFFLTFLFF